MNHQSINEVNAITLEDTKPAEKPQYDFSRVDALLVKVEVVFRRKIPYASLGKMIRVTPSAICRALGDEYPGRRLLEAVARWLVSTGTPYSNLVPHDCEISVSERANHDNAS